MLCIWLNNVSRLVFWQPPKCLSVAREVAKLFAWHTKNTTHIFEGTKNVIGQLWQLWQLWQHWQHCGTLAGRQWIKSLSQCRNATGCSLITSYLFWQYFELFFMLTASRKYRCNCCNVTEALKASSTGVAAWDCQPSPLTPSQSLCLSVSISGPQTRWATAGLTLSILAGDLNMLWRGLEDVVAVVDFFHAFHVQRDHSMAT